MENPGVVGLIAAVVISTIAVGHGEGWLNVSAKGLAIKPVVANYTCDGKSYYAVHENDPVSCPHGGTIKPREQHRVDVYRIEISGHAKKIGELPKDGEIPIESQYGYYVRIASD